MDTSPAPVSIPAPVSAEAGISAVPHLATQSSISSVPETPAASKGPVEKMKEVLGESLLIVLLTAFSYLMAYMFKLGEYMELDISTALIQIELKDCLRAGALLAFASLPALMYYYVIKQVHHLSAGKRRKLQATILGCYTVMCIYLLSSSLLGLNFTQLAGFLRPLASSILIYVATFWILQYMIRDFIFSEDESLRGAADRLRSHLTSGRSYKETWFFIQRARLMNVTLAGLLLSGLVLMIGAGRARKRDSFENIQNTSYVVIDTFNDRLLCKTVNEKHDGLLPGFTLVPFKEGEVMSFVSLKLNKKDENAAAPPVPGPLNPAQQAPGASAPTPAHPATAAPAPATAAPAPAP